VITRTKDDKTVIKSEEEGKEEMLLLPVIYKHCKKKNKPMRNE
jgi:hypothetical protein